MGNAYLGAVAALGVLVALDALARADESSTTAASTTPTLEKLSLEELMGVRVRSATMKSQPVETVPSVISVVTDDQIHALGLRTLADALQLMPGVTVLPTQFGGQRVIVRGKGNASDILVTLDGERLNDFYDGSYLMEFPLENIARIELIRGPGSALWGTNAFAGVISMYSKSRAEIFGGLGAESYFDHAVGWGARAYGKYAHTFGRYTLQLFASYWDTSGPKILVERDNADPSYSQVPGVTDGGMRVAVAQLSLKREGLLVRGDVLELWALYQYRRRGPYFGADDVFTPDSQLQRESFHAFLAYGIPLRGGVRLQHRFTFDRRDAQSRIEDEPPGFFHDVDGNFTREPGELFPNGQLRSLSFVTYRLAELTQLDWTLPKPRGIAGNHLIVGALLEYSWLPSFSYGQNFCCGEAFLFAGSALRNYDNLPLTQVDKDRLLAAVFVHDELEAARHLWITVGLRLDYFSDFGATWNPRAAVVYEPHPRISFKLLYGRAFRAPSFRDLYDQTGVSETPGGVLIQGNPNLRPETTNTVEASVESSPTHLVTLRANAFYIRTEDVIEVDATFTVAGTQIVNYPGLQIWGGEAEAQLHFDERNYLSANLSLFDSTEVGQGLPGFQNDAERRFLDTHLVDLPRLRFNAIAVTSPFSRMHLPAPLTGLQLGVTYRYVSALANNNRFTLETLDVFRQPQYSELSINVNVPLWRDHLELVATLALAFGRTIAVPLTAGWYDLPTNAANLFVGLRAHAGGK